MNCYEKVLQILSTIKPNKDLSQVTDIIEGGYLDSFELLSLIAEISENFNIEIEIDDITPDNFNSVQAIGMLIERLALKK